MNPQYIDIGRVLRSTAVAAACQLRGNLMDAGGAIESEVKADGSRVTPIDFAVERTMGDALRAELADQDLVIVGEEGTIIGTYGGADRVVFFDPTDGTALVRLLAPGSTTGCCLYDKFKREFVVAAVADPWLERVVFTDHGITYRQRFNAAGTLLGEPTACQVSEKSFAHGGELLVDSAHEFTRNVFGGDSRRALSQGEITRFWGDAHTKLGTKVRMCSSNLMQQLLLAVGGDAIATIMTAIGGPWDMSGIALVKGAGGTALYVESRADMFVLTDDPMTADLVICANTLDIAEQVYTVLSALRC